MPGWHVGSGLLAQCSFSLRWARCPPAPAAADFAQTALNIIPSGQYGSVPPPPGADDQAQMYDGLTPLFDQVTNADLTQYFKSERVRQSAPTAPGPPRRVPRPGVTIIRDKFNVPHVNATTYDGGIWAAGWIAAEDRGLLLQQARYNARVAAIDAPGAQRARPDHRPAELPAQRSRPRPRSRSRPRCSRTPAPRAGRCCDDIDTFISGINDYLAINSPSTAPWTRNDVYARQRPQGPVRRPGRRRRGPPLAVPRRPAAAARARQRARASSTTCASSRTPRARPRSTATSTTGSFPSRPKGSVILDPGSFQPTPAVRQARCPSEAAADAPAQASNTLMIDAEHSATGHPLMVGGPQIGYFYPGLTYEIDMHAPGLQWRGATSAPFPGYMLIGRGEDFATTLTSASGDIIDQYAETLCGGSDTKYLLQGRVPADGALQRRHAERRAGQVPDARCTARSSATRRSTGKKVAISSKRSSYGKDVLDQLFFRRLSNGAGRTARSRSSRRRRRRRRPSTRSTSTTSTSPSTRAAGCRMRPHERRSRPADRWAPGSTSGRASCPTTSTSRASTRATGRWPTGTTAPPTASAPRTTTGAATARPRGSTCSTTTCERLRGGRQVGAGRR